MGDVEIGGKLTGIGDVSAVDLDKIDVSAATALNLIRVNGAGNALESSGSAVSDFATAAQGATADSAVQPGGALGTPSSGTLTNCTGLPVAGGGTGATTAATARANLGVNFPIMGMKTAQSVSTTRTFYPFGGSGASVFPVSVAVPAPFALTAVAMSFHTQNAPAGGETWTVYLYKNGVSASTFTVTAAGVTASGTISIAYAKNDLLAWGTEVTTGTTTVATNIALALECITT